MSCQQVDPDAEALRQSLVTQLKEQAHIRDPRIAAAFSAVPRHLFVTNVSIEEAYRDRSIPTKQLDTGAVVSSCSQPTMIALMLEQLDVQPGQRVLEIGAGTGYNAALIAHLVGDRGHVITIDVDEDIVSDAKQHLAATGFNHVDVIRADGGQGFPNGAPFDRIILTVGAWDIAPAWREQLMPNGRIVLPLSICGPQLSIAFQAMDNHLVSQSAYYCEFIRLRGGFAGPEIYFQLGPEPELMIRSEHTLPVPATTIYNWLNGASRNHTTELAISLRDVRSNLPFWLGLYEPGYCGILGSSDMAARLKLPDLLSFSRPGAALSGTIGLVNEHGLCLLARTPEASSPFPLHLQSYGNAEALSKQLLSQLQAWDAADRPGGDHLDIAVYPLDAEGTIDIPEGAMVMRKQWHQYVLRWRA